MQVKWTTSFCGLGIHGFMAETSGPSSRISSHALVGRQRWTVRWPPEVKTRGDLIVGLIQLAVAWADAFDSDVMEVLKYCARHEASRVRSAVIQGLLFTKWPQVLPILKDLADKDEAGNVRDFAPKGLRERHQGPGRNNMTRM